MIVVIQNTDHIMITEIVGKSENGLYSAAITCTVVVQFVYYAIIDSFRPVILENKKNYTLDRKHFQKIEEHLKNNPFDKELVDDIIKNLKNNSNPKRNISIIEVPYKTNDSYEYLGKLYEFKAVNDYR